MGKPVLSVAGPGRLDEGRMEVGVVESKLVSPIGWRSSFIIAGVEVYLQDELGIGPVIPPNPSNEQPEYPFVGVGQLEARFGLTSFGSVEHCSGNEKGITHVAPGENRGFLPDPLDLAPAFPLCVDRNPGPNARRTPRLYRLDLLLGQPDFLAPAGQGPLADRQHLHDLTVRPPQPSQCPPGLGSFPPGHNGPGGGGRDGERWSFHFSTKRRVCDTIVADGL